MPISFAIQTTTFINHTAAIVGFVEFDMSSQSEAEIFLVSSSVTLIHRVSILKFFLPEPSGPALQLLSKILIILGNV